MRHITPAHISALKPNEIFVFGSNLGGRHGKGAALYAKQRFGAEQGVGVGLTGKCYALPTVAGGFERHSLTKMGLLEIEAHVRIFIALARMNTETTFLLTPVGCGLAGWEPKDIAPMFLHAPNNVTMPQSFQDIFTSQPDRAQRGRKG